MGDARCGDWAVLTAYVVVREWHCKLKHAALTDHLSSIAFWHINKILVNGP